MPKKYCPSNGSEGDWFESKFCMNCIHTNPNPEARPQCNIWANAICSSGINDPEFPNEWTYDSDNKPTCTAWVKWDWGNDGDPNDPDNPKSPIPENPNQLVMPFIIDEIEKNTIKEKQLISL